MLPGRMGFYCNCCIIRGRGSAHLLLGDLGASQLQKWHNSKEANTASSLGHKVFEVFSILHGVAFRIKMLVEDS